MVEPYGCVAACDPVPTELGVASAFNGVTTDEVPPSHVTAWQVSGVVNSVTPPVEPQVYVTVPLYSGEASQANTSVLPNTCETARDAVPTVEVPALTGTGTAVTVPSHVISARRTNGSVQSWT